MLLLVGLLVSGNSLLMDGPQQATLVGHDDGIRAVAFSPSGTTLTTASLHGLTTTDLDVLLWKLPGNP